MINIPECKTCPRFYLVTDIDGGKPCPLGYSYEALRLIPKVGCLSHPKAGEYLMQDVIKKMEETIKCNNRWAKPDPYYSGVNAMCIEVISMIKNGVEK